jgi:hypothetical protein
MVTQYQGSFWKILYTGPITYSVKPKLVAAVCTNEYFLATQRHTIIFIFLNASCQKKIPGDPSPALIAYPIKP